ncbi:Histone acetyltransferase type B catalytic subunit [Hyphodiscus hymeniophilus]|uniref:Histone acetyltransferase type B catalytic subunit n=1 Tax=Hyphodiscus hymeniophilus TaxID=353542 RepID=A0A9P7AVS4_9HELO|nr:Histone acetyltransferase type B catalytic subunit [Hyphodiscus hymeniophilus]
MADVQDDWSTDSNNAINISLVVPGEGGLKTLHSFNPKMTYSIFGEAEKIFGYQGLKINLRYNACDMRPGLQIMYTKKFKTVGETSPTDLKEILEPYLPKTAFEKSIVFDAALRDASYATWRPPGQLWKTIEADGRTMEIWKGSMADLAVQQMVKRVQILVPLFIEGGTPLGLDDPEWSMERWTVFFLYQKANHPAPSISPYTFMGYSTVYRYFLYQPILPPTSLSEKKKPISHPATLDFKLPSTENITFSSLPCRSRISQFVILPPFHGGGNGSRFYNSIFEFYSQERQTIEITVEDPNVDFDDLRDINDLLHLRTLPQFTSLRINTNATPRAKGPVPRDIIDLDALEKLRTKVKIAPRQFYRVMEMQLLSAIPLGIRQSMIEERIKLQGPELVAKKKEYHLWQLFVKKRLYRHNKDTLMQLDRTERIDKLEEALGSVEADFARLLREVDKRSGKKVAESNVNGASTNGSGTAKRSSPDEAAETSEEPVTKRVKFAE